MQATTTAKVTIPMDAAGNLTIPAELRAALGVAGAVLVEVEVVDRTVVLRPGAAIPEEDVWAHAPEHVAAVKRAQAEGQGRRLSEAELERLIAGS